MAFQRSKFEGLLIFIGQAFYGFWTPDKAKEGVSENFFTWHVSPK